VNISVRMIADCVLNATDTIVLVSADSDLVPPLEFIQKQYPEKRIKVYFPPSNFSCDLKDNLTPVFRVGSLMCFAPIPAPPACIAPTVPRPCRGTPF
jgi:hypothetical protein